jgi:hypothetical protein
MRAMHGMVHTSACIIHRIAPQAMPIDTSPEKIHRFNPFIDDGRHPNHTICMVYVSLSASLSASFGVNIFSRSDLT